MSAGRVLELWNGLRRLFGLPVTAAYIRAHEDWQCIRSSKRYVSVEETDEGIRVEGLPSSRYKNMRTGETVTVEDQGRDRTSWHRWGDEWPEYAREAYLQGDVWKDDLDDLPDRGFGVHAIGTMSHTQQWRRVD